MTYEEARIPRIKEEGCVMKKLKNSLFVLMAFVFFLFGTRMVSAAEEGITNDGFKWSYDDGIMAITGYEGNAARIDIPSKINGIPMTKICDEAFYGCDSLQRVTIPNSVTYLGYWAFRECHNLTSITIPDTVTYIRSHLLYGCTRLKSIRLPNTITHIEWHAFGFYEDSLEQEYKVPGFTIYGDYGSVADSYADAEGFTFVGEVNTKDVVNGVLTKFLSYQKDIIIPEGITEIGDEAFAGRIYDSIKLPKTVKKIGKKAFFFCTYATSINIPDGVTEIGAEAFEGCYSLESITIPNQITKINPYTFSICSSVKRIVIPDSVTEIADFAFVNCEGLTSLTIPDSVKKIGESAFANCNRLASITLPNSVTKIAKETFSDCTSLKSITIPKSVTEIEEFAFEGCSRLKIITIPGTVKKIGSSAFGWLTDGKGFKKVKGLIVCGYPGTEAERFAKEEGFTFKNLSDKTYTVSEHKYKINKDKKSVTYCGPSDKTFVKVKVPDTITISGVKYKVTVIGKAAFKKCTKLKTVTIGKNVATIGNNAFSGCQSLQKVMFAGSKIKNIGTNAFYKAGSRNYKKLTVIVPKTKYKVYKKKLLKAKLSKNAIIKK